MVCFYVRNFPIIPRRFPLLVSILNIIIGLIILIRGIKKSNGTEEPPIRWESFKYVLIGALGIIAYAVAMKFIHFFPATIIFIPLYMLYLRVRNWKVIILCDICMNLFLWWMFIFSLKTVLP